MSTEENKGLLAQATEVLSSAVESVKEAVIGTDQPTGAAPTAPHGEAPSNANPSGEVAYEDKTLVGKAADLTNRAVEAVTAQVNNITGSAPSSGEAPTAPHGEAPSNANPSGDVAFQDKTLAGKAQDLGNRAVEAVTAQVNNITGSAPSSGATPSAPKGEAPSNANPSGEVAFQDKTLAGKAADLTNQAVEAVSAGASSLAAQANTAAQKVGEHVQNLTQQATAATQQATQAVKDGAQAVKEGAQQTKEGTSTKAEASASPGSPSNIPGAFVDPKTGDTKIVLSGFSSGDAETLSERSNFQ